jgi:hypothetical protein
VTFRLVVLSASEHIDRMAKIIAQNCDFNLSTDALCESRLATAALLDDHLDLNTL